MSFKGFGGILLAVAMTGCSPSATSVAARNDKLFQSAEVTVKADWDTAKAAMQTNGFAAAIFALKALQSANLKPEQLTAVNKTVNAVSKQMYDAANKGDSNAVSAIEKLAPPRR